MSSEKEAIKKVVDVCIEVFDLTGRSVPSNHHAVIQKKIEELKKIKEEIDNGSSAGSKAGK